MHISSSELGHHWFRQWYGSFFAPIHYLNQWWPHWTLATKFQPNAKDVFQGNTFKNIICNMSAIFVSGLNVLAMRIMRICFKGWNIVLYQDVKNSDLIVTHLWRRLYPGWQETVEEYIQKAELWESQSVSVRVDLWFCAASWGSTQEFHGILQ